VTWIALALAGLVVGAVITVAASRLARPNVGLSAEPSYAGVALAPPPVSRPRTQRKSARPARAPRATTPARPVTPPVAPVTTGTATAPATPTPPQAPASASPQQAPRSAPTRQAPAGGGGGDGEHADD